ncbi:hypothetical protein ACFO0S_06445, partial [Chryseomicrobium palamuruense]
PIRVTTIIPGSAFEKYALFEFGLTVCHDKSNLWQDKSSFGNEKVASCNDKSFGCTLNVRSAHENT